MILDFRYGIKISFILLTMVVEMEKDFFERPKEMQKELRYFFERE
jgi:hypothetical protein